MERQALETTLQEWVSEHEANGIAQHSKKWLAAKIYTIGGSSLATIQGKNPYSNVQGLIQEKIGLTKFALGIAAQWGNLFEDVIKKYVEHDKKCTVLGENMYVDGPTGTSYSPDGLAVIDFEENYTFEQETTYDTPNGPRIGITLENVGIPKTEIVLCEFKCPYSRIPTGTPPIYYVPQVKMGLDLLKLPYIGLLAEGVFRRCEWGHLGNNPIYDKTLVPRSSGKLPLAYGMIGFYHSADAYANKLSRLSPAYKDAAVAKMDTLWDQYDDFFIEKGGPDNNFDSNDLATAPPDLFTLIMDAYDKKLLSVWYGDPIIGADDTDGIARADKDMQDYTSFCAKNGFMNFGILPWKLFRIEYNFINKEENFLAPWLPKIREVIDVVRSCNEAATVSEKLILYGEYVNSSQNGGFSDA